MNLFINKRIIVSINFELLGHRKSTIDLIKFERYRNLM